MARDPRIVEELEYDGGATGVIVPCRGGYMATLFSGPNMRHVMDYYYAPSREAAIALLDGWAKNRSLNRLEGGEPC